MIPYLDPTVGALNPACERTAPVSLARVHTLQLGLDSAGGSLTFTPPAQIKESSSSKKWPRRVFLRSFWRTAGVKVIILPSFYLALVGPYYWVHHLLQDCGVPKTIQLGCSAAFRQPAVGAKLVLPPAVGHAVHCGVLGTRLRSCHHVIMASNHHAIVSYCHVIMPVILLDQPPLTGGRQTGLM